MANDRFVSAIEQFVADDWFEAPTVGAFNSTEFRAFVLFYLAGDFQQLGSVNPDDMFLWGNADPPNNTGWSIQITNDNAAPLLRATVGDGNTTLELDTPIIASGEYIERLILAGLYVSGDFAALTVNGNIAAFDTAPVTAPSALKARVGLAPDGTNPALYAGIAAAGYQPGALAGDSSRTIGLYAAQSFRAAREDLAGSLEIKGADADWLHRYEARSFIGMQATLTKNATGQAKVATPAYPFSIWPDVGNSGFVTSPAAAAPLNHLGI